MTHWIQRLSRKSRVLIFNFFFPKKMPIIDENSKNLGVTNSAIFNILLSFGKGKDLLINNAI